MEDKIDRLRNILHKEEWNYADQLFIRSLIDRGEEDIIKEVAFDLYQSKTGIRLKSEVSEEILDRITKKISRHEDHRDKSWYVRISIAATFLILVLAYFSKDSWNNLLFPVQEVKITTSFGEIKDIELPDGSHIWLNGGSSFEYPSEFRGEVRNVYLSGEAFFDVAPDKKHPFIIKGGDVVTTVVGTQFNVKAYEEDTVTTVSVVSGSVKVSSSNLPDTSGSQQYDEMAFDILLKPNQEVSYNRSDGTTSNADLIDLSSRVNWRNGQYNYKGVTLEDVLKDFRRGFDVEIIADEAIKKCRIYADFGGNTLEEILDILGTLVNAELTRIAERQYEIKGEGCY